MLRSPNLSMWRKQPKIFRLIRFKIIQIKNLKGQEELEIYREFHGHNSLLTPLIDNILELQKELQRLSGQKKQDNIKDKINSLHIKLKLLIEKFNVRSFDQFCFSKMQRMILNSRLQ